MKLSVLDFLKTTSGGTPITGMPIGARSECFSSLEHAVRIMDEALGSESEWPLEVGTPIVVWVHQRPDSAGIVDVVRYRCYVYGTGVATPEPTPIVSVDDPVEVVAPLSVSHVSPFDAASRLREWFGVNYQELSRMTGIGRTTFFYWKRTGATPQARTLRPLWRLYALAQGVREALGEGGAFAWFNSGSPSHREMLMAGDLEEVERRAHRLLFQQSTRPSRFRAVGEEDIEPVEQMAPTERTGTTPRRAARRPTVR